MWSWGPGVWSLECGRVENCGLRSVCEKVDRERGARSSLGRVRLSQRGRASRTTCVQGCVPHALDFSSCAPMYIHCESARAAAHARQRETALEKTFFLYLINHFRQKTDGDTPHRSQWGEAGGTHRAARESRVDCCRHIRRCVSTKSPNKYSNCRSRRSV